MFIEFAIFLEKILYVKRVKDWSIFRKIVYFERTLLCKFFE